MFLFVPLHFEIPIHLGVAAITDLYVTLPQDVTAVPQNYTVHCLIDEACECAVKFSISYYMLMEGTLSEPAVLYCNEELSLPCTEEPISNNATTVHNQLTVTWDAKTVLKQVDYNTPSTPANGDHDFLCLTSYTAKGVGQLQGQMRTEEAFVSIRGIYKHIPMHACRCQK